MDIGALLLILAVIVLTISYILKPLRSQKPVEPEKLIGFWVDQARMKLGNQKKEEKLICPNCGEAVRASDRFCSNCGKDLMVKN
jgi:ribosomal protein S27AE